MASALVTLFALTFAVALSTIAADPDLLQDICVAELNSTMKVNGYPCRERAIVDDFFSDSLAKPGAINGCMGYQPTPANVQKIPGLNTLGVLLTRIDFAPGGLNPPHTHPRATEMVYVLNGALTVGFITANGNNLGSRPIKTGEIFVFPEGLVHFQQNNGDVPASVIATFDSQNPGIQSIPLALFKADPPVPDDVLSRAFTLSIEEVETIKNKLPPK